MRLLLRLIGCFAGLIPSLVWAEKVEGIGEVAQELIGPATVLSNLVGSASIIIGVACIFGSFVRYMQHRVNPMVSPWSTIIFLFILGIVLLCLPFIYKLTGVGIPFSVPL